ncbi:primosomal replication protein PriC [Vibrio mediterranei]
MKLSEVKARLEQLHQDAQEFDFKNRGHKKPLFDEHLFSISNILLQPCVIEAERTLDKIITLSKQGISTSSSEIWVTKFTEQLEAIERVLLIANTPTDTALESKSLEQLRADLRQHQVWEQKLCTLVRQQEQCLTDDQTTNLQLISTEQRLQRCRNAMNAIQHTINQKMRFI